MIQVPCNSDIPWFSPVQNRTTQSMSFSLITWRKWILNMWSQGWFARGIRIFHIYWALPCAKHCALGYHRNKPWVKRREGPPILLGIQVRVSGVWRSKSVSERWIWVRQTQELTHRRESSSGAQEVSKWRMFKAEKSYWEAKLCLSTCRSSGMPAAQNE